MAEERQRRGISRRGLLVGGGLGVGLVVAWAVLPRSYGPSLRAAPGELVFNAFVKIGRDGRVIVAVPQVELGQGVYTSLPQILADELGADWRTVAVEPAPVGPLYANPVFARELAAGGTAAALGGLGDWAIEEHAERSALMLTGGSSSVRAFEARFREAGAAARALLSMAAGERWSADWEQLDTAQGFVTRGGDRIPFGALAERAAELELPEHLPVRGGLEGRITGQSVPRIDLPAKVDGTAMFAGDVRLPGMIFAASRSGPPGSRLSGIDREAGRAVPGVIGLVENPHWAAAAGTTWWAALRGLEAMRPRFRTPAGLADNASIDAALATALASDDASRVYAHGDPDAVLGQPGALRASYSVGPASSAPIETLTATARVEGDRLEIWAATQAPALARAAAARAVGFSDAQVTVHPTLAGGGYGRRFETDAIEQAAILAFELGRPVQLTWPRLAEIQQDRVRPPASAVLYARLAEAGTIAAWRARIASPRTMARLVERSGGGALLRPGAAAEVAGAVPPYSIPSVAVEHATAEIGIETGLWRGGAHSYTAFFTECFIDELSRRTGIEPFSFRMQMLGSNPRLARCLSTATTIGGWDGGPPGSGIGIACHSAFGSHIALLVEIEIGPDQQPRVLRAVAAVDCGRVVNPEIVKQQIEGGIAHGISGAIGNPLRIEDGRPAARTIAELGLPTLAASPEVTVEIMPSEEDPGGVTELGVPAAGPAVANAYFSLTGRRPRTLPIGGWR